MTTINEQLDAGVDLLEGLLVKKAGLSDAVGLVEGLYPGAAAAGLRNFPESTTIKAPRIGEVYTKGHAPRSRGSAGRRRLRPGTRPVRHCGTSREESRGADAVPGDPSDAARVPPRVPVIGTARPCRTRSGRTSGGRASTSEPVVNLVGRLSVP